MPQLTPQSGNVYPGTHWDQDLVFAALGESPRRRMLASMARGGFLPGSSLHGSARRTLDATLKHLAEMRSAGLVVVKNDPKDGRRFLYGLSPAIPLQNTPEGLVIDFGFCLLRVSEMDPK